MQKQLMITELTKISFFVKQLQFRNDGNSCICIQKQCLCEGECAPVILQYI